MPQSHHVAINPPPQKRTAAPAKPNEQQRRPTVAVAASAATNGGAPQSPAPRPLPDLLSVRAVLFDIDGTLTDSDPLHFLAFQEILIEKGFNGGAPIDEAFFRARISGRHNPEIAADLFPDWTVAQHVEFYTDKEQRFRDLAGESEGGVEAPWGV